MPDEITIRDVAKLVGFSTGTVSRVLNGAPNVNPEINSRILRVLKETGYLEKERYRPGRKTRRCGNRICMLAPDMSSNWRNNPWCNSWLSGIEDACRKYDYSLDIQFAHPELSSRELSRMLRPYDGILLRVPALNPEFLPFLPRKMPVVSFDSALPNLPFPQVAGDEYAAGKSVTDELMRLGHEKIAFVNPEISHREFSARCAGYIAQMVECGKFRSEYLVTFDSEPREVNEPLTSLPDLSATLDYFLSLSEPPSAVIFANDWTAAGFYTACLDRKVSIPDVFSVVAFDNTVSVCEILHPKLSSYQLPQFEIAYRAAERLFEMIESGTLPGRCKPEIIYLFGKLIQRDSIKNLPAPLWSRKIF